MIYLELTGTGAAWFDDLELTGVAGQVPAAAALPAGLWAWRVRSAGRLSGATRGQAGDSPACPAVDSRLGGMRVLGRVARTTSASATRPRGADCQADAQRSPTRGVDARPGARPHRPRRDWRRCGFAASTSSSGAEWRSMGRRAGRCLRLVAIGFRPVGRFAGEFLSADALQPEPTLRLYRNPARQRAKEMLPSFVGKQVARAAERTGRNWPHSPRPSSGAGAKNRSALALSRCLATSAPSAR